MMSIWDILNDCLNFPEHFEKILFLDKLAVARVLTHYISLNALISP